MTEDEVEFNWNAAYRRWAYMILAIVAALMLEWKPVFSFQEDKGIIYVRSFSMDQKTFVVTQTEMDTNIATVTETMSVKWLYYCYKGMLWGCILCALCFFSWKGRVLISITTAIIAGSYYIFMIYYAMRISDDHFATLYPTIIAIMPAIVCQMMLLVRRNVINDVDPG